VPTIRLNCYESFNLIPLEEHFKRTRKTHCNFPIFPVHPNCDSHRNIIAGKKLTANLLFFLFSFVFPLWRCFFFPIFQRNKMGYISFLSLILAVEKGVPLFGGISPPSEWPAEDIPLGMGRVWIPACAGMTLLLINGVVNGGKSFLFPVSPIGRRQGSFGRNWNWSAEEGHFR